MKLPICASVPYLSPVSQFLWEESFTESHLDTTECVIDSSSQGECTESWNQKYFLL